MLEVNVPSEFVELSPVLGMTLFIYAISILAWSVKMKEFAVIAITMATLFGIFATLVIYDIIVFNRV